LRFFLFLSSSDEEEESLDEDGDGDRDTEDGECFFRLGERDGDLDGERLRRDLSFEDELEFSCFFGFGDGDLRLFFDEDLLSGEGDREGAKTNGAGVESLNLLRNLRYSSHFSDDLRGGSLNSFDNSSNVFSGICT